MKGLLPLTRLIDALNERVGQLVYWLLLAATLISCVNAVVRKAFSVSSNAYLEAQWYLFAAVFMLGAGYTLLHDKHVRIDVLASRVALHADLDRRRRHRRVPDPALPGVHLPLAADGVERDHLR